MDEFLFGGNTDVTSLFRPFSMKITVCNEGSQNLRNAIMFPFIKGC